MKARRQTINHLYWVLEECIKNHLFLVLRREEDQLKHDWSASDRLLEGCSSGLLESPCSSRLIIPEANLNFESSRLWDRVRIRWSSDIELLNQALRIVLDEVYLPPIGRELLIVHRSCEYETVILVWWPVNERLLASKLIILLVWIDQHLSVWQVSTSTN